MNTPDPNGPPDLPPVTPLPVRARLGRFFEPKPLTRPRVIGAFVVAAMVDGAQFALGPLGWAVVDQALDAFAMVATIGLLGFHVLLLPTVILEALPVVDLVPTWLGCVAVVVARRRAKSGPRR